MRVSAWGDKKRKTRSGPEAGREYKTQPGQILPAFRKDFKPMYGATVEIPLPQ